LNIFILKFIAAIFCLYVGVGIGTLAFGYLVDHISPTKNFADVLNPMTLGSALALPILVQSILIKLIWAATILVSIVFVFWPKSPRWLISIPFIGAVLLGYMIVDAFRSKAGQ
jgi:hypothetical protein